MTTKANNAKALRALDKHLRTVCAPLVESGNGNTLGVSVDSAGVLGKNDKERHSRVAPRSKNEQPK